MPVQPPLPESGLTIEDIKDAVAQAREDVNTYPSISLITENVPEEYEPDTDADI